MTSTARIASVRARQILDSRGRPTVEADVTLDNGSFGRACAPSGASRGIYEACELRDGDPAHYDGLGVKKAVANVNEKLASAIRGQSVLDQEAIDTIMRDTDGTASLERIGANAVLAVSMAVACAAAEHERVPLYRHLANLASTVPSMPMPMTNILSGGAHAGRGMDLQDFLMIPVGAKSYSEALEMISHVRLSSTRLMKDRGLTTLLADEGGLSPGFGRAEEAMELMVQSFESAGLRPGDDAAIALDVAASELFEDRSYRLAGEGKTFSGAEMADFIFDLARRYPVVSIEDPLDQDDWDNWRRFASVLPNCQIVGDDLFVTNVERIRMGIEKEAANAALIKLNQNGTVSGTIDATATAKAAGFAAVVSARSGETEDTFIADLSVALGAGQIKIGSVRSSERLAKYNRLLRIEEDGVLPFAGVSGIYGHSVAEAV
ncbi:phosphopyruvate hydratase [Rhizorhapis sp. SPR117]|uniref:phosphopyruvate hydratase n=1 Tax=Rhizorhapis sp. SPR117 TaxID=2912611 RepID=UPI001F032871|nr:phosphopyruvate hydratase [Rhizorhapis sp. SPR117]